MTSSIRYAIMGGTNRVYWNGAKWHQSLLDTIRYHKPVPWDSESKKDCIWYQVCGSDLSVWALKMWPFLISTNFYIWYQFYRLFRLKMWFREIAFMVAISSVSLAALGSGNLEEASWSKVWFWLKLISTMTLVTMFWNCKDKCYEWNKKAPPNYKCESKILPILSSAKLYSKYIILIRGVNDHLS